VQLRGGYHGSGAGSDRESYRRWRESGPDQRGRIRSRVGGARRRHTTQSPSCREARVRSMVSGRCPTDRAGGGEKNVAGGRCRRARSRGLDGTPTIDHGVRRQIKRFMRSCLPKRQNRRRHMDESGGFGALGTKACSRNNRSDYTGGAATPTRPGQYARHSKMGPRGKADACRDDMNPGRPVRVHGFGRRTCSIVAGENRSVLGPVHKLRVRKVPSALPWLR